MINKIYIGFKRRYSRFFIFFLGSFFIISCNAQKIPEIKPSFARTTKSDFAHNRIRSNGSECNASKSSVSVSLDRDIAPVWISNNKSHSGIFPDAPVRAYRMNAKTCIQVTGHEALRLCGKSLSDLKDTSEVVYRSPENKTFENFDYHNWLFSPYVLDDHSLVALAHSEWYGCLKYSNDSEKYCKKQHNKRNSWANAVTLYRSTDGGASWDRVGVVERPDKYPKTFESIWGRGKMTNFGFFHPSNIIREGNRYYSFVLATERDSAGNQTKTGMILLSTTNPLSSAWEQVTSKGNFIRQPHSSQILPGTSGWTQVSVTWNSAICKYLILFWDAQKQRLRSTTTASLTKPVFSDPSDVLNQDTIRLPQNTEVGLQGINYPIAQLDPDSRSDNFETTDDNFFLFMNSFNRKNIKNRSIFRVTARLVN